MFAFDPTITVPVILSVITLVFAWYRTRDNKLNDKFEKIDERMKTGSDRMDRHEVRLNGLEQTVKAMPDKEDLHALQLEMVRQTGSINEMSANMAGHAKIMARMEIILSRHEDHLLGGSIKK